MLAGKRHKFIFLPILHIDMFQTEQKNLIWLENVIFIIAIRKKERSNTQSVPFLAPEI